MTQPKDFFGKPPKIDKIFDSFPAADMDIKSFLKKKSAGGELSYVCECIVQDYSKIFNPQDAFERLLAVEEDKATLRKELKQLLKKAYEVNKLEDPVFFNIFILSDARIKHTALYKKYKVYKGQNFDKPDCFFSILQLTFPDLFYAIVKKRPNDGVAVIKLLTLKYKNFQPILGNIGLLGLLPKGKKYGGYVKVLLHLTVHSDPLQWMEMALGACLNIYQHSFVAEGVREQWFNKLGIDESDCAAWSKIFNRQYPEYVDVHEFFGQIA